MKIDNLTGKIFGKLTVIRRADNDKYGRTRWFCKCSCGNPNEIIVSGYNLKAGQVKSCGCLKHKAYNKKYNKYDLSGDCGIGWTTNTNHPFYFDLEDYNKIKDYCWRECHNYIISQTKIVGKEIRLYRLVIDAPSNMVVDHINHNTYDNRKINLRICTKKQNFMNRKVKGIYKHRKKYIGSIEKDGIRYFQSFKTKEDAIKWRKEKEVELFGNYAYKDDINNEN